MSEGKLVTWKRGKAALKGRIRVPIKIPLGRVVRASLEPGALGYRMGECVIIVGHTGKGWHLSISHASRYPTWDEIADARYSLLPDEVTMAMMLPPRAQYVNVHPNCFHLWQVYEEGSSAQFSEETRRQAFLSVYEEDDDES